MANIKQTDILEYLVRKFNANALGVKFRMGSYGIVTDPVTNELKGITIYAPKLLTDVYNDQTPTFNETTYQTEQESFVVMGSSINFGQYVPLPNVFMVSYKVNLTFLVSIDSAVSELIRMAIEQVRDSLIGNLDTIQINEVDMDDESESSELISQYLKIATTSSGIDFGQQIQLKGRVFLEYALNVDLTISKNVEFGNQFEWKIADAETFGWNYLGINLSMEYDLYLDQTGYSSPQTNLFPNIENSINGTILKVDVRVDYETVSYYYQASSYYALIPLIGSIGAINDLQGFQTLKSINNLDADKAKEIHNYVKSRGFAATFTFLLDNQNAMLKKLFKESFDKQETPNKYKVDMKFKQYVNGSWSYDTDIAFNRRLVVSEAIPHDIVYGTPIIFTVGLNPSAK